MSVKYRNYQIYWILLLNLHHHRFPANFPAVFHVCPISGLLFGLHATPKTKEVKSFIFHSIARLRTPPACIRYRVFIFLAKRRAS